jgi:phosphoserine phosphatase
LAYELGAMRLKLSCRWKLFCDRSDCQTMQPTTIIWDFDGTLLPLTPYDSEQTLMLYKLDEAAQRPPCFVRALARLLIGADRRQLFRRTFKRFYIRLMKGTPTAVLAHVGERLSDRISLEDRQTISRLKSENYRMMILSCGTADLSKRTIQNAGLGNCFDSIAGNRFIINKGVIDGMTLHVANPADKVRWLKNMGITPDETIAVGDGYTDIPLLDWAKISVLVDRTGKNQIKYSHKNYRFVQSLTEIFNIVQNSV